MNEPTDGGDDLQAVEMHPETRGTVDDLPDLMLSLVLAAVRAMKRRKQQSPADPWLSFRADASDPVSQVLAAAWTCGLARVRGIVDRTTGERRLFIAAA